MTPEEYERLKEAEKQHLRKLRELKQAVRELERQKKVTRAVENITDEPRRLFDEQKDLVDQIAMEAARSEAKLEIAMESADAEATAEPPKVSEAEAEEVIRRQRAKDLVRRLRNAEPEDVARVPTEKPARDQSRDEKRGEEADRPPLPEKTIGRMKP